MAKSIDYEITLYPAHHEGGFVVEKLLPGGICPKKRITAAGMQDLIEQVTTFAKKKGVRMQG